MSRLFASFLCFFLFKIYVFFPSESFLNLCATSRCVSQYWTLAPITSPWERNT